MRVGRMSTLIGARRRWPVRVTGPSTRRGRGAVLHGATSLPNRCASDRERAGDGTIAPPMLKSLIRTFKGPSRDPRMAYISRPLPRGVTDEEVVAALEIALSANREPAYLPETLPDALEEVTGRRYQVLDRSVRDVTGTFFRTQVMIRDGDVGSWPGYAAMSYPLLAPSAKVEEIRAAIVAADTPEGEAAPSVRKAGWEPPPPAGTR
jgi:hypothetical protein